MKIGILVAMDKELRLLLHVMGELVEQTVDGSKMYCGNIGSHEVIVAKCGIGKVNSALTTLTLINFFNPDLVINSGVAGGAGNGVKIGQLLVADKVCYHDVWCGPGTDEGAADGCDRFIKTDTKIVELAHRLLNPEDTVYGLICSGDRFIASAEEVRSIRSRFPEVKAVDMESASIAQVCFMKGKLFNILRIVSDTPGEGENIEQYQNFWGEAPFKTFEAVKILLESL
ncbi:MAG: 5'-methylthioadenosine/adenosylhomocysteine nucleosidase [Muribaculaceae bacterium]|nr:5'-methylthioadenosine/adenosylhomocysteine nucleosidase [Muribaculaceae bacterium]